MKRLLILFLVGLAVWQAYGKYNRRDLPAATIEPIADARPARQSSERPAPEPRYTCDGRTHCSQMTSCEEATWFLRNCPGTKMDGNNDGVPCEKQWCR